MWHIITQEALLYENFDVGSTIDVDGTLNEMYSSVMVPEILADYINGSEDF